MASTYSPNLKIELIGTGEQQGTWGTTTNNNLGTLLEQAIAGWESVTVTDGVDTTLVLTDGAASNARNMTLSLAGALTATRNVICPAIEKMYIVRNGTTGGFPVTFKVTGQTGVSIPFGQTMIIYVDGTDARQASLPVSNANVTQISSIELGAASDTTITRSSAGVIAVEGVTVPLNSITSIHTAQQIELGNASDTTIARGSAGAITVEGVAVSMNNGNLGHICSTLDLGTLGDTTISRVSAGVIAVEGGTVPKENRANTFTADQTLTGGNLILTSTTFGSPSYTATSESSTNAPATITLGKSRAGPSIVAADDYAGSIYFQAFDGTAQRHLASMYAAVDGTPGANDMPGRFQFFTSPDGSTTPTEAMRITNAQYLLVGYTASNGAYRLQVNSQIFATSATIATSDGRYKENVTPISGALDAVMSLNPVQFSWKDHPIHNFDRAQPTIGFIAQEVQGALADKPYLNSIVKTNVCTIEEEVRDEDGNVTSPAVTEDFLGIADGHMIPLLTKALQELKAEFDAYKAAHP